MGTTRPCCLAWGKQKICCDGASSARFATSNTRASTTSVVRAQVYGIVSSQLILTALVSFSIVSSPSTQRYLTHSPGLMIAMMVLSFLLMIPLYMYKDKHPHNLVLLGSWTGLMSLSVGLVCSVYTPFVVLEALAITAAITAGLTVYTFYATRKGHDLTYLGPFLFASLWGVCVYLTAPHHHHNPQQLVIWGFFQMFFPVGPVGRTVFALIGAVVFSGYIVFDTHLLIARFDLDDYIWASVQLYLDIINLFLKILQLLGNRND